MKEGNFEIVNRSKTIDKKKAEVERFNEELKKYLKDTDNSYLVGGSEYFGDTFCIKPLEINDTKNGFIVNVYTMNMSDFYTYGRKDKWTKDKYLITTKKENGKTIVWGWSDENSDIMEGGFAKPFAELKRCLKKSIKNYEEGIDFSMDECKFAWYKLMDSYNKKNSASAYHVVCLEEQESNGKKIYLDTMVVIENNGEYVILDTIKLGNLSDIEPYVTKVQPTKKMLEIEKHICQKLQNNFSLESFGILMF